MRIGTVAWLSALSLALVAPVFPHEGEDHTGASLGASAGSAVGGVVYVPVETQILAHIETAPARMETVPLVFRVLGRTLAKPGLDVTARALHQGRLSSAASVGLPKVGDVVAKGQLLAVVEESIPTADLVAIAAERARAASQLKEADAELALAKRESDRLGGLKGAVPEREIAAAQAALEVATAKRGGLLAQVALLHESDADGVSANSRREIVAPLDGTIAEVLAADGESVAADAELFRIVSLSELYVEADVFENDASRILTARSATLKVEAYPGVEFPATLVSKGVDVEERTRSIHVRFSVANPDGMLFTGMFGTIYVESGGTLEGITIPKSSVVDLDGQPVAYVKAGVESFVARPLQIVERLSDRVLIRAGDDSPIKEGDRVVVQGTYQVRMSKPASAPIAGPGTKKP